MAAKPTYEQIAAATRIAAKSGFAYIDADFFSMYDKGTQKHDREVAILCVTLNDLWYWACADCEQIEWDHITLFEKRLDELMENPKKNQLKLSFLGPSYAAIKRNCEPVNWFEHYTRSETKGYLPIDEESKKEWEESKNWWKENLK